MLCLPSCLAKLSWSVQASLKAISFLMVELWPLSHWLKGRPANMRLSWPSSYTKCPTPEPSLADSTLYWTGVEDSFPSMGNLATDLILSTHQFSSNLLNSSNFTKEDHL